MTQTTWYTYPSPVLIAIQSTILLIAISVASFALSCASVVPLLYSIYQYFIGNGSTDTTKPSYKTVFITGGSSGIGKYLALKHAMEGAKYVFITGRNQTKLDQAIKELKGVQSKNKHPQFIPIGINVDVSDSAGMRQTLQQADDDCGGIDVVYANAGVSPENMKHLPPEVVTRQTFDINITGVVNTVYPLYDRFIQRQAGHFVLISSLASYGAIASAAYSASKAAVTTFGQALRRDLRPHHVHVTVVCPGYIRSGITEERHKVNGLPLFMETDTGASVIYQGVTQQHGFIAFPYPLHMGAWLLRFLPFQYQDFFLHLAHKYAYRPVDQTMNTTTHDQQKSD